MAKGCESEEIRRDPAQRLIDSAIGYAIIGLDRHGVITDWSRGAARLFGYQAGEVVGRPASLLFVPEDRDARLPESDRRSAAAQGLAEVARWHLRRDGSRFWARGILAPLDDGTGFVAVFRDRTDEKEADEALRAADARFRILATSIPQLVWRSLEGGFWIWGSPQWQAYTGQADVETHGEGWLAAVHPDDRERTREAWHSATTTRSLAVEHRLLSARDGRYRWFRTQATPLCDESGRATEWFGTSTDIDDLRRLQQHQQTLLAELQHRTRNLLALVRAIARQTLQRAVSLEDFRERFNSRLGALSRVQGLLATEDATVTLADLVRLELAAHGAEPDGGPVRMQGPVVKLPARTVQTLALALHELATNALKHGALARPEGRLKVTWSVRNRHAPLSRLRLVWRESGVPLGRRYTPERRGYGRELIERALAYDLGAETALEFSRDGVVCRIDVPIEGSETQLGRAPRRGRP